VPKKNQDSTPYRIPNELLARAGELAPLLDADPTFRAIAGVVDRASVVRLALTRGLEILETETRKQAKARKGGA
jgi:hypothetical protein